MNTKKFFLGTLGGGVAYFILGYLIYVVILGSYFESHSSATSLVKDPPDFLFLIIGNLAYGALLAYIFEKWATISTAQTGLQAGAVIGLLVGLTWDLITYATMDGLDITATLLDVVVMVVVSALVGAVVGWILGMVKS